MEDGKNGIGETDAPGRMPYNDRGVALLIVLLVTSLLIALVFEFAYGTRVSLRAAVNFRDSQRAYYLARSGVNFAGVTLSYLKSQSTGSLSNFGHLEQRDWQTVPVMTETPDVALRVRWEDESSKVYFGSVIKDGDTYNRLTKLFEILGISQSVLDQMAENKTYFHLLTELHQFLSDQDFAKVQDLMTVNPVTKVNVNTAPSSVLQSIGLSPGMADMVVDRRNHEPFTNIADVNAFLGPENTMAAGSLDVTSDVFLVDSFATVGGYTKQVEAAITRTASGFTVLYWRAL